MGNRWRRVLANISLAVLAVIVVLAIFLFAEGVARRVLPGFNHQFQVENDWDRVTHFDPELGWFNDPLNKEFGTDSSGFRRSGSEKDIPRGSPRILVLGDSTTFGLGVRAEDTFVSHLNRRFDNATFINGGVTGYGTIQEYLLFREAVEDKGVSHVILLFHESDFHDNVEFPDGYPRPVGIAGERGITILNFPQRIPLWRRLLYEASKKSYLFNILTRTRDEHAIRQLRTRILGSASAKPLGGGE